MDWLYTPFTVILLALAAFAVALAQYAWHRRSAPGAIAFTMLMLAVAQWEVGYAFEIGFRDLPTTLFWAKAQYLGIVTVPVAWLLFALHNSAHPPRRSDQLAAGLSVVPLVTLLLTWTNEAHGLIWSRVGLDPASSLSVLDVSYGPWFWVHTLYSYGLITIATALLLQRLIRGPALYRRQVAVMLGGIVAPWIGNALYLFDVSPVRGLDLAPFSFTITGAAFAWSLFRFRLLDIVPVARDAVIEHMRDGVIVLDALNRVIDVNPAAQRIIGLRANEVIGQPMEGVLPAPLAAHADVLSQTDHATHIAIEHDGEAQHYELSTSTVRTRSGQPTGSMLVLRNISRRVRAEAKLRESEARYRAVSEMTSDYAYSYRANNGKLELDWVTDAFERITSFTPDEVAERGGWTTLIHPDDLEAVLADVRVLAQGQSMVSERRIVTKSGDVRWLRFSARPLLDDNGCVVRILGAGQDITERKLASQALKRERDLLNTIINSTPDNIYLKDTAGRFLMINKAQMEHLGATREQDVIGKTDFDFFSHAHATETRADEQRILEIGEPMQDRLEHYVDPRGHVVWISATKAPIRDEGGSIVGIVGMSRDITERKLAEAALRESEQRYRRLFDSNPSPLWVYDRETLRFLAVNKAAMAHYGYSHDEFLAMTIKDIRPPVDVPRLLEQIAAPTVEDETPDRWQHLTKDGRVIDVEITSHPVAFAGRDAKVVLVTDITERLQAEGKLRESEARYRSMFDKNQAIKLVIDPATSLVVDANQAAADFYGYPRSELIGKHMGDINTLQPGELRDEMYRAAAEQKAYFVFQHRLADGTLRDVEVYAGPIETGGKRLVYSIIHDITERRQAETALRQQNEYLAALYGTLPAILKRLDVDDVLEAIVMRAAALVGTAHGYIYLVEPDTHDLVVQIGLGIYDHRRGYRIRPDDEPGLAGRVYRSGQPIAIADYQQWDGRRHDFDNDPLHANVGVPLMSGADVVGVLGLSYDEPGRLFTVEEIALLSRFAQLASIALDNARLFTTAQAEIAERRRIEANLELARDQALEAARLKDEFLAVMSHELRTPLNAIIGFTELTLEEQVGPITELQRNTLHRVSRNAHNLLALINNILDMSKMDAGHIHLQHEPINLSDIALGAITGIEALVTAKSLQLDMHPRDQPLPPVYGDAGRLHQIATNLLSNAVKFTPPGGTITVALEHGTIDTVAIAAPPQHISLAGEWVALSVRDTGIGIPSDEHERVWSEFYQIDASVTRQYGGTGLGLAIVKRLTHLMGGHVGLRSDPGAGATFTLWLPVAAAATSEDAARRARCERVLTP
jgi:PAS domain S-box-containing protein